jgi:hypothetical protein
MTEYINILIEALNLSYSLIGEVILMEKALIDKSYSDNDFFDKYIHIATILDQNLEKTIYHYATNLNFFIDPFTKKNDFFKNLNKKDYKAVFITDKLINDKKIIELINNEITVFCITDLSSTDVLNKNIKLININKRSEYLESLKSLKISISKSYKKRFYLEIIKQNHEIEFSNYLALKSKINKLKEV